MDNDSFSRNNFVDVTAGPDTVKFWLAFVLDTQVSISALHLRLSIMIVRGKLHGLINQVSHVTLPT